MGNLEKHPGQKTTIEGKVYSYLGEASKIQANIIAQGMKPEHITKIIKSDKPGYYDVYYRRRK
jgi:hypothetical protein